MARAENPFVGIDDIEILQAMYGDAEDDYAAARADHSHIAVGQSMRLKALLLARINELEKGKGDGGIDELSDEEFVTELRVQARGMPDDHLEVFVREWAHRGKVYPPPELD